jgi:hypothetical protein
MLSLLIQFYGNTDNIFYFLQGAKNRASKAKKRFASVRSDKETG